VNCKDCKNYKPKDWATAEPCPEPAVFSTLLGKPYHYWYDLLVKYDSLIKVSKKQRANIETLKANYDYLHDENQRLIKENCDLKDPNKWGLRPTHTITTYMGKPLEYWNDLEQKYNELREINNSQADRIDKALDYLKP